MNSVLDTLYQSISRAICLIEWHIFISVIEYGDLSNYLKAENTLINHKMITSDDDAVLKVDLSSREQFIPSRQSPALKKSLIISHNAVQC